MAFYDTANVLLGRSVGEFPIQKPFENDAKPSRNNRSPGNRQLEETLAFTAAITQAFRYLSEATNAHILGLCVRLRLNQDSRSTKRRNSRPFLGRRILHRAFMGQAQDEHNARAKLAIYVEHWRFEATESNFKHALRFQKTPALATDHVRWFVVSATVPVTDLVSR